MGDKSVIGPPLALFGKIEQRLGHLEEHLDIPSAPIGHDNLLVVQGGVGGQQGQPLFGAPVPDEHDLCRNRDALVVFADLDHDRSENLCAAATLADLPIDGCQMEIFPLVAIEDLFRDLEHAEGMHPLGKQVPHDCGIGKPAVEQKMLGLDPACKGLGHHLHKDIGCLADAFPATPRPVGTAVKVRTQRDQPVLFLAGGQQRTGDGQNTYAVGPSQDEHPEAAVIPMVGMVKDPRKQFDILAPIAAVKRIIGDQHLHVGGAGQRLKLLADHPGTQQQKESPPIGMDRVEKPIYCVLGHAAASTCFEGAEKVLSSESQGDQNPEHGDRRNALLLVDVASLQQAADFLIEKELMNLVFTGNDVWYNLAHSVTSCVDGLLLGNKTHISHFVTLYY